MPRKVFFSFHYDDVTRANVVRKSDAITRRYQQGVRFYDKSLWEKAKKEGALAIKRMINGALHGSSVTCVLIGKGTWQRTWVRYEILKSMVRGNGILGIQIQDVGFSPPSLLGGLRAPQQQLGLFALGALPSQFQPRGLYSSTLPGSGVVAQATLQPGPNPLRYLGYTIDRSRGTVTFHEVGRDNQWRLSEHVDPVRLGDLPWLSGQKDASNLADLFKVYGWKNEIGAQNFPAWVEAAARQAGR
jgi:hypothetical protein